MIAAVPNSVPSSIASEPLQQYNSPWPLSGSRYHARQPILDLDGRLHAYELLFRSSPETHFSGDGIQATRTMIDNTLVLGMERLTGGFPGFINCTSEAFTENLVEALPHELAVLEILETLEATPQLIQSCHKLKDRGFRLALDDFRWRPDLAPLVDLADYIKVDFLLSDGKERRNLIRNLKHRRVRLLAEKVETLEEFETARDEGFSYFQGYYFCKPTLVTTGEIPPNKLAQLHLLRILQQEAFDLQTISNIVEKDAAITYRLLRIVNSPIYAYRRRVRSVETALMVMGENAFRRVARLAIAAAMSTNASPALLHMALVRARFCELSAPLVGLEESEQYFLGMFSLLEAMLRVAMDQAIAALDLRAQIQNALLGERSRERSLLCWMEANERGDWATCDAIENFHHVGQHQFSQIAGQAILWADNALYPAFESSQINAR